MMMILGVFLGLVGLWDEEGEGEMRWRNKLRPSVLLVFFFFFFFFFCSLCGQKSQKI